MDKRIDRHFLRSSDPIGGADTHLSEDLLLLAIDGELSVHEASLVREHVEACWSCRARRDEIEESIGRVVEYSNFLVRPHMPLSSSARSMFLAALRHETEKPGQPSFWKKLTGLFHSFAIAARRPVWISAGALLCVALLLFAFFRANPVVSAAEAIQKSQESERKLLQGVPHPVVYQKLKMEYAGRKLVRTVYRIPSESQPIDATNMDSPQADGLASARVTADRSDSFGFFKGVFENAGLNWSDPLSAGAYKAWESANPDRVDEIVHERDGLTSIRSTTSRGKVAQIIFTLRANDFHPVEEEVRLQNAGEIEIAEDEYEIFSLDAVSSSLLALKGTEQPRTEATAKAAPVKAMPVSPTQIEEVELRARMALHVAGADLGDQIDIIPDGHGAVLVEGVVNSSSRQAEIEAELNGLEGVRVNLVTPDEPSLDREQPPTQFLDQVLLVEDEPMLEAALKEKFPNIEDRKSFVDSALAASDSSMEHIWALRRLAQRYAPEDVARMTAASRQILELLVRDHVGEIRNAVDREAEFLQEILPTIPSAPTEQESEELGSDWWQATDKLFGSLEIVQHDTSVLLAGSQNVTSVEATIREDRDTVSAIRKKLPRLNEMVSGNFLARPQETIQ